MVRPPSCLASGLLSSKALMDKNGYLPENIFNMDEIGYSIGTTQSSQVLAVRKKDEKGEFTGQGRKVAKKIPGRQEWVTAIECFSSTAGLLPPLMIFQGSHKLQGRVEASRDAHRWLALVYKPQGMDQ